MNKNTEDLIKRIENKNISLTNDQKKRNAQQSSI